MLRKEGVGQGVGIRELEAPEIDAISGGVTAAGILGVGAGLAGTLALVPGPQQLPVAGIAGALGLAAAGAAFLEI